MLRKDEILSAITLAEMPLGAAGRGANLASGRHRGKGDLAFANGHVETVIPRFGTNPVNSSGTSRRNATFYCLQTRNLTLQLQ